MAQEVVDPDGPAKATAENPDANTENASATKENVSGGTETESPSDEKTKPSSIPKRWHLPIALQTQREKNFDSASGFVVDHAGDLYLVTAQHATEKTSAKTRILFRRHSDGDARWVVLGQIIQADRDPWHPYKASDLSVARLSAETPNQRTLIAELTPIAWRMDDLLIEPPAPGTEIETIGFPLALGIGPNLAALVVPGHIVSTELISDSPWGKQPILYGSPAVASGASGAPVVLRPGKADAESGHVRPKIVGMQVAVQTDQSGAKLSKWVPARCIHDAIKTFADRDSWARGKPKSPKPQK